MVTDQVPHHDSIYTRIEHKGVESIEYITAEISHSTTA